MRARLNGHAALRDQRPTKSNRTPEAVSTGIARELPCGSRDPNETRKSRLGLGRGADGAGGAEAAAGAAQATPRVEVPGRRRDERELVVIVGRDRAGYTAEERRRALTSYPDLEVATYDKLLSTARSASCCSLGKGALW